MIDCKMKTIQELRSELKLHPEQINSWVKFFKTVKIDWKVYLPSIGKNLQRDFVWSTRQKQELIWSILLGRNIARMAMIYTKDEVYQIIDGKQRLAAMLNFVENKFKIIIGDKDYFFCELPQEYQTVIENYAFPYYIVHDTENKITDEEKITWFKFINFAGTAQDKKHIESLTKYIQ